MYQSVILAQDSGSGGSSLGLLFFLIIPVAMYFLMIRPQRKRMREQASLQASIGVGDEVVTNSGIYGFITGEEDDDKFWLEIDENVQIRIARAAIQGKVGGLTTPAVESGTTGKEPIDTTAGDDGNDTDTK
jgi:preprotein translocase subunit YajC